MSESVVLYRESECKSLTQSGKNFDALKVALDSPPLRCKDAALKVNFSSLYREHSVTLKLCSLSIEA